MMKALVFDGTHWRLREMPAPSPAEGEVLIRIMYAGICGTDRAILSGNLPVQTPLIPGHEFVGRVVDAPGAGSKWIGHMIVGEMNITCGKCRMCRIGEPTQCISIRQIGMDIHGAFAEYLALPADNLHPVPSSLPPEKAVLTEPLAACLRSVELAPVHSSDTVAILGPGIIGTLTLQALRAQRPAHIVVIGRNYESLRYAAEMGADTVINNRKETSAEKVKELTEGVGADYTVETTGTAEGLREAAALTRPRGTLILKSTTGKEAPFPATDIVVRELCILGTRCGPFERAIDYLARELVPGLAVEIYSPEDFDKALEARHNKPVKKLIAF